MQWWKRSLSFTKKFIWTILLIQNLQKLNSHTTKIVYKEEYCECPCLVSSQLQNRLALNECIAFDSWRGGVYWCDYIIKKKGLKKRSSAYHTDDLKETALLRRTVRRDSWTFKLKLILLDRPLWFFEDANFLIICNN